MAHHKRRRPKSTRAGCLMCKPHKRQGCRTPRHGESRRMARAKDMPFG